MKNIKTSDITTKDVDAGRLIQLSVNGNNGNPLEKAFLIQS